MCRESVKSKSFMHILFNGYHLCWDPALVFCIFNVLSQRAFFVFGCRWDCKVPANAIGLRAVAKEI